LNIDFNILANVQMIYPRDFPMFDGFVETSEAQIYCSYAFSTTVCYAFPIFDGLGSVDILRATQMIADTSCRL